MNYYIEAIKKYAVFTGRSRRSEYWYFVLFNFLAAIAIGIVSVIINDRDNTLSRLYTLAMFLPALGVTIRRLHDIGKSGWWIFMVLIPLVGAIILIVWEATDGQPGSNKYGPNPKEVANAQQPAPAPAAAPEPAKPTESNETPTGTNN
jgi:uncharacterized membrane protein YhaH (DUF805 family)